MGSGGGAGRVAGSAADGAAFGALGASVAFGASGARWRTPRAGGRAGGLLRACGKAGGALRLGGGADSSVMMCRPSMREFLFLAGLNYSMNYKFQLALLILARKKRIECCGSR